MLTMLYDQLMVKKLLKYIQCLSISKEDPPFWSDYGEKLTQIYTMLVAFWSDYGEKLTKIYTMLVDLKRRSTLFGLIMVKNSLKYIQCLSISKEDPPFLV